MLDTLLSAPFAPFSVSLALLFGLLALELALLVSGGSLLGAGDGVEPDLDLADAPSLDLDAGLDFDAGLEIDLDAFDIDPADFDLADGAFEPGGDAAPTSVPAPASPLGWLGLGKMPTLIWLATMLLIFGVTGIALQAAVLSLTGSPLAMLLAVIPSAAAALWLTGRFGTVFARAIPGTETQSVSSRTLGRRRGIVTQGIARRDMPAEVRVTDRYGNTHYLRAEPMRDGDAIPEGAEVLVLRHRPSGSFRLVPL